MRPKFTYSDIKTFPFTEKDINEWNKDNNVLKDWITSEKIPIKSVYTKQDLAGMEHLHFAAGLPPVFAWSIFGYVRNDTMDDKAIRRIFYS
jgi:methylmalonyl-CoA mutase